MEGRKDQIMSIPKYSATELEAIGEYPATRTAPPIKIYDTPISPRDNYNSLYRGRGAAWQALHAEIRAFAPRVWPDFISRGWVNEAKPFDPVASGGGTDMFGVDWEYVPVARGSMVKPGNPILKDANDWKDIILMPDINKWDWAGSAAENNGTYLKPDKFNQVWIQNGFFERLISFMDFEGAAIAVIDPDQQEAVYELFGALASLYVDIIDKFVEHFENIDCIFLHDDWGSQQSSFFAPEVARDLIVPHMRTVSDHVHEIGLIPELHSCGKIENMVPNIIDAGWDGWSPQPMNDIDAIYREYGDQLIIGITPEMLPANANEDEQRRAAQDFAERYCNPDRPTVYSLYGAENLLPAYCEELYIQSRFKYSS